MAAPALKELGMGGCQNPTLGAKVLDFSAPCHRPAVWPHRVCETGLWASVSSPSSSEGDSVRSGGKGLADGEVLCMREVPAVFPSRAGRQRMRRQGRQRHVPAGLCGALGSTDRRDFPQRMTRCALCFPTW